VRDYLSFGDWRAGLVCMRLGARHRNAIVCASTAKREA
jgi:hypothetical protein